MIHNVHRLTHILPITPDVPCPGPVPLEDYHHLCFLTCLYSLSDEHLVYNLSSVFKVVSSLIFNVSMFIIIVVA